MQRGRKPMRKREKKIHHRRRRRRPLITEFESAIASPRKSRERKWGTDH